MRTDWLAHPKQEWLGIVLPPFMALALVLCFPRVNEIHPMTWLLVVVCIDVAHVYSTLFRTYWSAASRQRFGELLWVIPLVCLVASIWLHMYSTIWFWRILAYAAVWHFVRQQYGFLRLYQRHEKRSERYRLLGQCAIYAATLYPLLFWHCSGNRNFHWMVEGDFILLQNCPVWVMNVAAFVYWALLALYGIVELAVSLRSGHFNVPKNMVLLGTAVSWYFGIVYLNGDWAFTALNVISHGLPYMTLIWLTDRQHIAKSNSTWRVLVMYVGVVLLLAILEETFWDIWVWRDHPVFFEWLYPDSGPRDRTWLNLIVPVLALPQLVHYVLDGFIWKRNRVGEIIPNR